MRRAAIYLTTLLALVVAGTGVGVSVERLDVLVGVPYRTVDSTVLRLDVYRPDAPGPHPAVVAIHGGSWRGGDRTQWRPSAAALTQAGFVVFAIDYRLSAPGGTAGYGDAVRDVERAVAWVAENAAAYDVDADAIGLLGSSAGAHLALIAGQKGRAKVTAVATWSPPVDLVSLARGPLAGAIRGFIGCSLGRCPSRYERMSPRRRVAASDPPTMLANSTNELIPLRHVRAMNHRLEGVGVAHRLLVIPGTAHGQQLRDDVLYQTISFLRSHLEVPRPQSL